jgi:hypothetical protein
MNRTSRQQTIFNAVAHRLASLSAPKRWMTAPALVRYLTNEKSLNTTVAEVEELLIHAMESSPDCRIRYSYYPSRKTLDVLWGHTDIVGHQQFLPDLERIDPVEDTEPVDLPPNAPFVFLSHNYRDAHHAMELRRTLAEAKIGVWVFEHEIQSGGRIVDEVRTAIQKCDAFAIYLSRHSLGSLWVDKELDTAASSHQPLIIVDGTDMDFLRLLQSYSYGGQGDVSLLRPIAASTAPTQGTARKNWLCRYEEHARQLNRLPGTLFTWPPLPEDSTVPIGRFNLKTMPEFGEGL